ncbi:MAG: hypothetical protein JXB33_00975 [Clostridia bacterium]|nr:hypothetical protein [Clostridia bacterium]
MNKKALIAIVAILFIGVLFQTMVIIDYHSEGFDIGFFERNKAAETYYKSLNEILRDKYLKPFDIMVRSEGKTWILKRDEDLFKNIWQDAKTIMQEAGNLEYLPESTYWGNLCIERNGITYSLGQHFPVEYVQFVLETESLPANVETIDKFMMIPGEKVTDIYFNTNNGVYKTQYSGQKGLLITDNFRNLVDLLTKDPYYSVNSLTDIYQFIKEEVLNKYIEPDIPVSQNVTARSIPWITIRISDEIKAYIDSLKISGKQEREAGMTKTAAVIKDKLRLRSANTYATLFDSSDNLFFSNQFNMYEINKYGWVLYKYTPGTKGDEKGTIEEAFINAVETLGKITELAVNPSAELYVSRIEDNGDSYTFSFDYRYDSKVIALEEENHSAVITATATRTTEARVLPLNMSEMTGEEYIGAEYRTAFLFIANLNGVYNINSIDAYNMYLGYKKTNEILEFSRPVWIIERQSGKKEALELPGAVE